MFVKITECPFIPEESYQKIDLFIYKVFSQGKVLSGVLWLPIILFKTLWKPENMLILFLCKKKKKE